MTSSTATARGTQPGTPPPSEIRTDVLRAAVLAAVLAVVGALTGLLWAAWSPPGPFAVILRPGVFEPDETESFVAGDGRFLVLGAAIGLVAALVVWFRRPLRGVAAALGLAVGSFAGSLLMWFVGYLTGGGSDTGRAVRGSTYHYTAQLPLTVHAHGLLLVQPAMAMLVFGLLVAFAVRDDLGRPDPVRDSLTASIAPGAHPQYGWGYGDAAGPLQQGDLPPQQPGQPGQPF